MADALGGQQPRAGTVATHRQALGCAAPGEALPLPLGWSTPGRQLQLRPVLPAAPAAGDAAQQQGEQQGGGEEGLQGLPSAEVSHEGAEQQLQALHDWSRGSSEGQHTLKLDSLDETITRLVCCPSLHSRGTLLAGMGASSACACVVWHAVRLPLPLLLSPSPLRRAIIRRWPTFACASLTSAAMGSAGSELDVADLWFSVTVEGDTLAGSKAAGAMTGRYAGIEFAGPEWAVWCGKWAGRALQLQHTLPCLQLPPCRLAGGGVRSTAPHQPPARARQPSGVGAAARCHQGAGWEADGAGGVWRNRAHSHG